MTRTEPCYGRFAAREKIDAFTTSSNIHPIRRAGVGCPSERETKERLLRSRSNDLNRRSVLALARA